MRLAQVVESQYSEVVATQLVRWLERVEDPCRLKSDSKSCCIRKKSSGKIPEVAKSTWRPVRKLSRKNHMAVGNFQEMPWPTTRIQNDRSAKNKKQQRHSYFFLGIFVLGIIAYKRDHCVCVPASRSSSKL